MIKMSLITSLSFLLISLSCFANDSNLDNFIYPVHECGKKIKKPEKVAQLKNFKDVNDYNSAIVEYNIEVATYNKEIKLYKSCINQYIKNRNHDINTIKESLKSALIEARSKK